MTRVLRCLLASTLLAGCYKTNLNNFSSGGGPGREVRIYSHTLILGLIPLTEIDVQKQCGSQGVWAVSTRASFLTLVASGFTSGIYLPMQAVITCKG